EHYAARRALVSIRGARPYPKLAGTRAVPHFVGAPDGSTTVSRTSAGGSAPTETEATPAPRALRWLALIGMNYTDVVLHRFIPTCAQRRRAHVSAYGAG